MDTKRKVAIVTGGASGIGKAICEELITQQVFVIIADVNKIEGKVVEDELNRQQNCARYEYVDVADHVSMEELVRDTFNEHGRLDYLFNNAGITMYGELYDVSIEDWNHIIDINLWGVIHGTQIGYKLMKEQGFGHIVNTSSAAGLGPSPLTAPYSATKHAIVGLTTSLHYEAKEHGVKVSVLCPTTFVDTPIFSNAKAINMDKHKMIQQLKKQKLMTPEKLAKIAINGVHQNAPIICPMPMRRTMDIFFSLFPYAHSKLMDYVCKVGRRARIS
ncbi:SDR family oxidoreductase [uncultured Psychrobacillus sp.]|uniref:SDR family NAD(P)-dependent oxidoreductase n=1 Tax=uncultured Psychrobacillus sp. TaxID=1551585 RepID=UPI002607BBD2|nr:SDR family oxidoreductase [uncultured Psychrobacillus sp.]